VEVLANSEVLATADKWWQYLQMVEVPAMTEVLAMTEVWQSRRYWEYPEVLATADKWQMNGRDTGKQQRCWLWWKYWKIQQWQTNAEVLTNYRDAGSSGGADKCRHAGYWQMAEALGTGKWQRCCKQQINDEGTGKWWRGAGYGGGTGKWLELLTMVGKWQRYKQMAEVLAMANGEVLGVVDKQWIKAEVVAND